MQGKNERNVRNFVDFSSGSQPVCQWFKSVVVFLEASGLTADVSEPEHIRSVETWMTEYDAWYRSVSIVKSGRRVRLLYFRELSAVSALANLDSLCGLSELAQRLGMAFSYTFDAKELCDHAEAARLLTTRPGFGIAGIRIGRDTPLAISALLEESIVSLVDRGVSIAIASPIERLRAFGLLDNPVICAAAFRLHPMGQPSAGARPPLPSGTSGPCSGLFRLHISRSGGVYPCLGLVDVPAALLGSIYRPFADSVFAGRSTALNIPSLARHGPVLESAPHNLRRSELPFQCEGHRAQLLRN